MTFIVTFVALIVERFFDWSHLRHWNWYFALQRTIAQRLMGNSPYLILALTIIPLLILASLLGFILGSVLYGVLGLVFHLLVLLYCLGPQNLWADGFACVNSSPSEFSKKFFGIIPIENSQQLHKQLLNNIFIEANRRIFAVIFWFCLLGPIGALLYRMINLSAQESKEPTNLELNTIANNIVSLLDWIPIRIFTFIFALGGHFSQVLIYWRKNFKLDNEILLTECGAAALGGMDEKIAEDGSAEKNAISLLDRAFIIMLAMLAVGVLLI